MHIGHSVALQAFKEHTVHFIGLLSDGGVHSRYNQLLPLLRGAP